MRIQRQTSGDVEVVTLEGRLDSTWAESVENALKDAIAGGRHHIRLDLAGVKYISSAGLSVLVNAYRELGELDGRFSMENVADTVRNVLAITGLTFLIDGGPPIVHGQANAPALEVQRVEKNGYSLEIYSPPSRPVEAVLLATPYLGGPPPGADSLQALRVESNRMAFGIGALGINAEDCLGRLGEFIAISGCAAVQTSDGAGMPDYVQGSGSLVPDIHVLYGIDVYGEMSGASRFEAHTGTAPIRLSELASDLLAGSGSDEIAVVLIAEAAGLVGAALRQSPARPQNKIGVYSVPDIREWLSFTPEPEYVRSLALITGIVSARPGSRLADQLRPMNGMSGIQAHFHAAVFPYRPLKRGRLQLRETISSCFEGSHVMAVLHLLSDSREIAGAGESELLRGFCWTAPLKSTS